MKLKFEFSADIPIKTSTRDIVSMTALLPVAGERAFAFGWAVMDGRGPLANERYWLADVRREGVAHRLLPESLCERFVELTGRGTGTDGSDMRILAFRCGEGIGLLLGVREVWLYAGIDAEPRVIAIENPAAANAGMGREGCFPNRLGHSRGGRVPVVLTSPGDGIDQGRRAALLEIDEAAGRARWRTIDGGSALSGSRYADYASLLDEHQPAAVQLGSSTGKPPLILDAAWIEEHWHLYVGGFSAAYHRFGLAPSVLSRNRADLSLEAVLFQAGEESFGRFCASGDRLLLTPLRKGGPRKHKQSVFLLGERKECLPALPRGYTKHSLLEYFDGRWWLGPDRWGYGTLPLVVCSEG